MVFAAKGGSSSLVGVCLLIPKFISDVAAPLSKTQKSPFLQCGGIGCPSGALDLFSLSLHKK